MHAVHGAASGPLCIYFHGCPGTPQEASWLHEAALAAGVRLVALDRDAVAPGQVGQAYFDALAGEVDALAAGEPVRLLGFSLGAFVAIQVAGRLMARLAHVDLVSPAGPLDDPAVVDSMMGAPIFRMAERSPSLFRWATGAQHLAVRLAPATVIRGLFGKARGPEAALAARPDFRAALTAILLRSYGPARAGYLRDIVAYVRPWSLRPEAVAAPVGVWQGEADDWTPPQLARSLAQAMADASLTLFPELGHYATLFEAAPRIFKRVRGRPEPGL